MLDNASNNNTMMQELQQWLVQMGIPFDADQKQIRYICW